MMSGARPVVVRGWNAWKKRINLRYWGIFWSVRPRLVMEMNLGMLRRRERRMTGEMWKRRDTLLLLTAILSYNVGLAFELIKRDLVIVLLA